MATETKKGKQKQRSDAGEAGSSQGAGKDPLEIAYGPIVGTDPVITEDDFEVDTAGGMHHPQPAMDRSGESSPGHGTPVGEEAGQDERLSEHGSEPSPTFSIGGDEDEFRNVWGK